MPPLRSRARPGRLTLAAEFAWLGGASVRCDAHLVKFGDELLDAEI